MVHQDQEDKLQGKESKEDYLQLHKDRDQDAQGVPVTLHQAMIQDTEKSCPEVQTRKQTSKKLKINIRTSRRIWSLTIPNLKNKSNPTLLHAIMSDRKSTRCMGSMMPLKISQKIHVVKVVRRVSQLPNLTDSLSNIWVSQERHQIQPVVSSASASDSRTSDYKFVRNYKNFVIVLKIYLTYILSLK